MFPAQLFALLFGSFKYYNLILCKFRNSVRVCFTVFTKTVTITMSKLGGD